jgi:hypothetical protein
MKVVDKRASTDTEELVALDYVKWKMAQAEDQGVDFDESMLSTDEYLDFAIDRAQGGDMFTLDRGAKN